ncbi:MAG: thioesterase II family protein [Tumebacillaceae bacterium]
MVQTSRWFLNTSPNPTAKLRLFCLPFGGGGASIYFNWSRQLPSDVEVIAIQPPGRENRIGEVPFRNTSQLVEELATEMLPLLDKPYVLFGHSMGALLAYELTCEFRRRGHKLPEHLYASSHTAPQISRQSRSHQLPDDEFWEHVIQLNGTPKEVLANDELRELVLPTLKADFEMCETHEFVPEAPLECPITVYAGLQESKYQEHFRAWSERTSGGFRMRMFPGDHFYLNTARDLLLGMLSHDLYTMCEKC